MHNSSIIANELYSNSSEKSKKEKYKYVSGQFPIAEWLANKTISLPVAPHVPIGFEDRIGSAIKKAILDAYKSI